MKNKFIFLLFVGLLFSSCTESMQYNNEPKLQAVKGNDQWEAYTSSAVAATAKITLVGIGDNESVTLKMELPEDFVAQGDESTYLTYVLGRGGMNQATYVSQWGGKILRYETENGKGDGEIVITNYDGVTISGTFRFNAANTVMDGTQQETVNFKEGKFYKIPITFN